MASKQVTDREKFTRAVAAAAVTHREEILTGIHRTLSPYLEPGETLPPLGTVLDVLVRWQEDKVNKLIEADRAHELELGDDAEPRQRRDEAAIALRAGMVDLRATVDAIHGETGLKLLGLDKAVPEDPSVLATQAQTTITALRDDKIDLGAPRRRSSILNRSGAVEELLEPHGRLVQALGDVARERREAEVTQTAKNQAQAAYDHVASRSTTLLVGLCEVSGRSDLAERLRPTQSRRNGSAQGQDGGGNEDTGAPQGGTSGT